MKAKRLLKRLLPSKLTSRIAKLRKRRSFDPDEFARKITGMIPQEKLESVSTNFQKDHNEVISRFARYRQQLSSRLEAHGCSHGSIEKLLTPVDRRIEDISQNQSLDHPEEESLDSLFEAVLGTIKAGKWELAVEQLVLLIQVYGFGRGNPLLRMAQLDLPDGAWQNGSVEGYPLIHMLDTLKANGLLSPQQSKKAYRRLGEPRMIVAQGVYGLLAADRQKDARAAFSAFLELLFDSSELRELWRDSFQRVADLFRGPLAAGSGPDSSGRSRIMVSGMGWSGSGAVYAYLSEFNSVVPVEAEFQHLSGVVSLRTLREAAPEFKTYRTELLRFFGLTLFGFARFSDYQEYRSLNLANSYTLSNEGIRYARAINRTCRALAGAHDGKSLDLGAFSRAAEQLLDGIPGAPESPGAIPMYDNVVKIYRMEEIDYIRGATLLCTFRDPRSTYVALYNEKVKFRPDVKSFIKSYRAKRERSAAAHERVAEKGRVITVQFEEFVSSEEYREAVAKDLGLSPTEQEKHAHFEPWVSIKNVRNFESFSDQRAIRRIEKELSEYLWEG